MSTCTGSTTAWAELREPAGMETDTGSTQTHAHREMHKHERVVGCQHPESEVCAAGVPGEGRMGQKKYLGIKWCQAWWLMPVIPAL